MTELWEVVFAVMKKDHRGYGQIRRGIVRKIPNKKWTDDRGVLLMSLKYLGKGIYTGHHGRIVGRALQG